MKDSLNMKHYTDLIFWAKYWKSHSIAPIRDVFFDGLTKNFPKTAKLIEIGGFPGQYAVYFAKNYGYEVHILDNYIDEDILRKVEEMNDVPLGTIHVIQKNFLETELMEEYDVVCSFGFIEHYGDYPAIIKRHIVLLKNNGILLITIPNFRGINGWIQKIFHKDNYQKHNIKCMKIKNLKNVLRDCHLKYYEVDYIGVPGLWLEKDANAGKCVRLFLKYFNKILSRLPFKNSLLLAPNIYIKAVK